MCLPRKFQNISCKYQWEYRENDSNTMMVEYLMPHDFKNDHIIQTCTKINRKWIKHLFFKSLKLKLLAKIEKIIEYSNWQGFLESDDKT